MGAVFRRELRSFLTSPIGYIILAAIYCLSGLFFFAFNLSTSSADMTNLFNLLLIVNIALLPFLTMRLFSDEKKQKCDQALFTAPVSLAGIVLGKFLATLLLFLIGLSITLVFGVVLAIGKAVPDWTMIIGNYLGLTLVGGFIITLGVFVSSLTESQVVAAFGTLTLASLWLSVDWVNSLFANFKWIANATEFLSITVRYYDFTMGLIYYDNVFYFLSLQALFLFLTVRVLDKRKWH